MTTAELKKTANEVRKGIIKSTHAAKSGHPGGSLSAADVFTYLYFVELNVDPKNPKDENRDRFVELGLMISALRKAKGYTQYELAEKAHISRSHLSSIEAPNISSSFSLEVFFNIADILEVKPGDLLNLNLPSSYFNIDEQD